MSNPRIPPNRSLPHRPSPKKDYYKNPRSDISSVVSHLVRAEKENYDLERKNKKYQASVFKLVNLLDKTSQKRDYYKSSYRQMTHKMDYLLVMSKIMKESIVKHIRRNCNNFDLTDNCTLCLERLDETSETVMITTCNHFFHKDCILKSLSSINNRCPNCRSQILFVELGTNTQDDFVPSKNNRLYTVMNNVFESIDFRYFLTPDEDNYQESSDEESNTEDENSNSEDEDFEEDEDEETIEE